MKHIYDMPRPVTEIYILSDTAQGWHEAEIGDFETLDRRQHLPPRIELSMTLKQTAPVGRAAIDVLRKSAERPVLAADEKALRNTTSMTAPAWKAWEPSLPTPVRDKWADRHNGGGTLRMFRAGTRAIDLQMDDADAPGYRTKRGNLGGAIELKTIWDPWRCK